MKLPIYLDNHATTPVDPRVMQAMIPFFTENFGNAASKQHMYGWIAEEAVEIARGTIARPINAEPREIVFTSGATESNNLAIKGVCEIEHMKGSHIITAQTEHRSVLDVCKKMEQRGFKVTFLPVDKFGMVNPDDVKASITDATVLVSVMMANNEIGTIAPIVEIGKICSERGVLFHTDATQAVGKIPVDVQEMYIHLMSFSAHKLYGPKGIAALYVRGKKPHVRIAAQMDGGGHENGMRSGTLNVPAIVGFGKAVEIAVSERSEEAKKVEKLRNRLEELLLNIEDTYVNGHPIERLPNNLNASFRYVHADDLMVELKKEIACSSGSACSSADAEAGKVSHVLSAVGLDEELARSSVRFGLGRFTTGKDIEEAGAAIANAVERLRNNSPAYRSSHRREMVVQ
jgi:cysteine desulfurase